MNTEQAVELLTTMVSALREGQIELLDLTGTSSAQHEAAEIPGVDTLVNHPTGLFVDVFRLAYRKPKVVEAHEQWRKGVLAKGGTIREPEKME